MERLLEQVSTFNTETQKQDLQLWANQMEAQIDKLTQKQGNFYYLTLSQFYAVFLRDIDTGYQMLKRVTYNQIVAKEQIKVRRCFYRYLEGAYDFAFEELDQIVNSPALSSRKIAQDFFKRIFGGKNKFAKSKRRGRNPTKQNYLQDFLEALNYERQKHFKKAKQLNSNIIQTYGDMDESIRYESAKNIQLMTEIDRSKIGRQEMDEYKTIIRDFQKQIQNKNYYQQKREFIFKILDFIDPSKKEEDDMLTDYQMTKKFMIQNLERSIAKTSDTHIKSVLKKTLQSLKADDEIGQAICYKFLGDQMYSKVMNYSQVLMKSKIQPKEQTLPMKKTKYEPDNDIQLLPSRRMKETASNMVQIQQDPDFTGSMMTKINFNSDGTDQRYFYIKQDFKKTGKLFYCSKEGQQSKGDDSYPLKAIKRITMGKKSKALKRKQCQDFDDQLCMTLYISGSDDYQRNFYIKDQQNYDKWHRVFQGFLSSKSSQKSRVKKTRLNV